MFSMVSCISSKVAFFSGTVSSPLAAGWDVAGHGTSNLANSRSDRGKHPYRRPNLMSLLPFGSMGLRMSS